MEKAQSVALELLQHCVSDHVDVSADGLVVMEIVPPDMISLVEMVLLASRLKPLGVGVSISNNENNVVLRLHPKNDSFLLSIEQYNSELETSRAGLVCDAVLLRTVANELVQADPEIKAIVLRLKKQLPSIEAEVALKYIDKDTILIKVPIMHQSSLHMSALRVLQGFTRVSQVKFGTTKHRDMTVLCVFVYAKKEVVHSRKRPHSHV